MWFWGDEVAQIHQAKLSESSSEEEGKPASGVVHPTPRSLHEPARVAWHRKQEMEAARFMDSGTINWVLYNQPTSEVSGIDEERGFGLIYEDWTGYHGLYQQPVRKAD